MHRHRPHSGKRPAGYDGAGRHTYRLVGEDIATKGTARSERHRAANRPKHVPRLRAVGQDDAATRCHGKRGRYLEQEYGLGVPTGIERQIARRYGKRRSRIVETRVKRLAADIAGQRNTAVIPAHGVVIRRRQIQLGLPRDAIIDVQASVNHSGRKPIYCSSRRDSNIADDLGMSGVRNGRAREDSEWSCNSGDLRMRFQARLGTLSAPETQNCQTRLNLRRAPRGSRCCPHCTRPPKQSRDRQEASASVVVFPLKHSN